MHKQTVCLCIIMKDESHVLKECLDSVVKHIDYYVISDTGSTDRSVELVLSYFKEHNIPGAVISRPWVNFGHNRSEVMKYAEGKADYCLVIDADDVFVGDQPFPELTLDSYSIQIKSDTSTYYRNQIFKNNLDWKYEGVLHEYATSPQAKTRGRLEGYSTISRRLGSRNKDPKKYEKDIQLLLNGIKELPEDAMLYARYHFYLAQSYRDAGKLPEAITYYDKRAKLGFWNEEVFYSLFQKAKIIARIPDYPNAFEEILTATLQAHEVCPDRAEALYTLARYCRETQRYLLGYKFGKLGLQIPFPEDDALFIHDDIYNYKLLDETGVNASWLGKSDEAVSFYKRALKSPLLAPQDKERIMSNLKNHEGNKLEGSSLILISEKPIIRELAKGKKCLVEVGVCYGGTSMILRETMSPEGKLYLVDPFPSTVPGQRITPDYERALKNVNSVQNGQVEWIRDTSEAAAAKFQDHPDFIFIDALHFKYNVVMDWVVWKSYVVPGGLVVFHDVSERNWPEVWEAWQIIKKEPGWECLGVHETLGVMKRNK